MLGTSPPNSSTIFLLAPMMDFVLFRKKPVGRMSCSSSSGFAYAKSFGVRIFQVQRFRDLVDAHVRALRRKNRGNQQLKRILVLECAGGVRIGLVQLLKNRAHALRIWSPRLSR